MNKISHQELKELLVNSSGTTIISILAATKVKVPKSAPFENLMKVSRINGMCGFDYSNSVNKQREREGIEEIFEAHKRVWGQRIGKSAIIEHNGADYLEMKVEKKGGYFYCDGDKVIEKEIVEPFLSPLKAPAIQGVEKAVILRDYRFDSIRAVTLFGKEFEIKD